MPGGEPSLLTLVKLFHYLFFTRIYLKADDILAYFAHLGQNNSLPSFEDLEMAAIILYDAYTSPAAQYEAADDARDGMSDWAKTVPLGTQWDGDKAKISNIFSLTEMANANKQAARITSKKAKRKHMKEPKKKASDLPDLPFHGDRTFSEAATFKRDAMISREVAYAAAEGDVGRMWEGLKVYCFSSKIEERTGH
jgi:hypothetical protein